MGKAGIGYFFSKKKKSFKNFFYFKKSSKTCFCILLLLFKEGYTSNSYYFKNSGVASGKYSWQLKSNVNDANKKKTLTQDGYVVEFSVL